ncbi:hypothetical protein F5888DRAFT_1680446 [Russula emetica]|nr:hypothetical protein F5888DRAFT_1680446 [Russula emetica]
MGIEGFAGAPDATMTGLHQYDTCSMHGAQCIRVVTRPLGAIYVYRTKNDFPAYKTPLEIQYHQPPPPLAIPTRPEKPMMMQAHILERILFVVIACTVIFAGLCLYTYLVSIYQSHWVSEHSFPLPYLSARSHSTTHTVYIATCTSSLSSGRWSVVHYIMHLPRSIMDTYRITAA